jgi:hypothetical protein
MPRSHGRAGMVLALVGAMAAPAARNAASSATAIADFSGGGALETVTAREKGAVVRLEVQDASGKRLARADAPSPAGRSRAITLQTGSIGSVGTLLEVAASSGATTCRTVWRFRDGRLSKLPILIGTKAVADCEDAPGWTTRWDESRNEPAQYVRERSRETPQGQLKQTQAFSFAGFELQRDARRSVSEIRGVPIPEWFEAELYAKAELDALFQRFGLDDLKKAPRLRFEIDADQGIFAVRLRDPEGEVRLPVNASKPLESKEEPGVELSAGDPPVHLSVSLARGTIPETVVVKGAQPRFDVAYAPVIHSSPQQIRVYRDAEQELATEALPGSWATDKNEHVVIEALPTPGGIRFGGAEVFVRLEGAPAGSDLLLEPRDRLPAWALQLRGPNGFVRIPVICEARGSARECRIAGDGQSLKRIGSQLNVR